MSSVAGHNETMAFHPGYYVAEIIEDMGITQAEFAVRMGTTPKTVSQLVNGQAGLSDDLAGKLSTMLGNSIEFWLNLQKRYDERILEIRQAREIDAQIPVMESIDYSYFVRFAGLPAARTVPERIRNLCGYLKVANLNVFADPDFLVDFRRGASDMEGRRGFIARIWLQTALNHARNRMTRPYNAAGLREQLPEIRKMTRQDPEVFYPRLLDILAGSGVAFVLLPHLRDSGVDGAVKWIAADRVVLALDDRMLDADKFWFSLLHAIGHVLQQKARTVFVSVGSGSGERRKTGDRLEKEADSFAGDLLIPPREYRRFSPSAATSDAEIIAFAERIGIHPGVVAGRLQHEHVIESDRCSRLKVRYRILPGNRS